MPLTTSAIGMPLLVAGSSSGILFFFFFFLNPGSSDNITGGLFNVQNRKMSDVPLYAHSLGIVQLGRDWLGSWPDPRVSPGLERTLAHNDPNQPFPGPGLNLASGVGAAVRHAVDGEGGMDEALSSPASIPMAVFSSVILFHPL